MVVPLSIILAFIFGATLSSRLIFSVPSKFLMLGGTYLQGSLVVKGQMTYQKQIFRNSGWIVF
jgi:hypothetical protein